MMKAYTIIHKELEEATTEHTTMTILDPCGYTTSDSLTYGVYFDMESFSSVIKTYRSACNLPVSLFTTYPEFAVETDAEGTKIKITNSASVDWDGRSIYIGSNSYTMIMPEYVFDKDKTELPVDTEDLYPGANPLNCYRLVVKRDGWEYNYNIDNKNLQGANKLPVLQGPAPAVATDEGISIRVYCDNHGGYVSLLRTTDLEDDDSWETIKANVYVDGYFTYVDKCNLVKDTTYYYKVIDDWDHVTYGGEYFSATATVNKGPFATIQTQPTLSMEDNSATITAGTFQLADPDSVDYIQTVYEYVEENNENRKLLIKYMDYTKRSDEIKAEYYIYENGGFTSSWGYENQIDVYYESVDGEKYIFNSAYVEFFEESYYNSAKLFKLDFTPTQGNYPAEIQIPNRKVGLALQATDAGVVLTITNIPEGASSIRILSTETYNSQYSNIFSETRSYMFSGDKLNSYISSGTMTFTDKYVNEQQQYYYKVTVYKTSAGYNSSDVCSITATGGSDEIGISQMPVCTFDSESNAVTYTQAASLTSQDDFPEDTYFNIRFNYRDYDDKGNWSNSGSFYYSSSISNYTSCFTAWVSGTYIPYNATLEITFPDYEYTESNVSIPANSSLPQQVVVVES